MRKNLICFTGKILLGLCAILFCKLSVDAQTVTIEGTGTTNSYLYSPIYSFNGAPRSLRIAYIYSQPLLSSMPSGSTIIKLQFSRNTTTGTLPAGNNLKLYLMNTSATDWGTTALTWDISAATLVFDADPSANVGSTAGYKEFILTVPFIYTGGNLAIFSEYSQVNAPAAVINWNYNTSGTQPGYLANQTKYTVNASTTMPTTLSTSTANHPNIKIDYTPSAGCTSPPTAGTSNVTPSTPVCLGTPISFNLTGNSTGTGQTYQWESSANIGGPYSPESGILSSPFFATTAAASSLYYRAAVTCGGNTQYSTPVQLVVNTVLPGGVYTINSTQPTGGTNYQSFTDAVNAFKCGITGPVVFNVAAGSGPYTEQISIPVISGSSAVNTVTFNGNGAILQATPVTDTRHIIQLNGADYITIRNLNILAISGSTFGWGVHLTNGADHNTIDSCTIDMSAVASTTQSNSAGIVGSGSTTSVTTAGSASYNTISNNTLIGAYQGIIINGTATSLNAVNNVITNNTIQDFYANGIEITQNDGSEISYNNIHRTNRTAVTTFEGVELGAGNKNVIVNANRIHDTHTSASTQTGTSYGVYLNACDAASGSENKVTNNLIYRFNSGSGTIYGLYNIGSDGVRYFHNTVALDNATSTAGVTRGFYQTTAATNIQFKNNIVYITRGGTGLKYCLYFATTTSAIISNKNVLYINSPDGTIGIGIFGTTPYVALTDWQTVNSSAYDQQSISVDPLFVNPGGGNYAPSASLVNNIGDNVGVTTDILGNPRTVASPDPGAYEFNPGGCADPPTAGNAISSDAFICGPAPFTLDLAGNSIGTGQTYQWQSSPDNAVWGNISSVLAAPAFTTSQIVSTYYRAAVQCSGGSVVYSASVFVQSTALVSGTFTINNGQPTGSNNFNSFNDAYNSIKCGINGPVVFNVVNSSGPYNEQVIINPVTGASATNTITFNGNGRTLQYLSTNTNERAVIKLNGANHIIFDSLVINALGTATTEYGFGIQLMNNADSNTINNCSININTTSVSTNYAGIAVSNSATSAVSTTANGSDYNVFSNNTITGGYYGFTLASSSALANGNNKLTNNIIKEYYQYGLWVGGSFNTLIEANTFTRPTRTTVTDFYGVYVTGLSAKLNITRNKITDPFGGAPSSTSDVYGVYFTASDPTAGLENIVSNNLIYNTTGAGDQYGFYNSSSDNVWYYHNTISLDGSGAGTTSTNLTRGFYQITLAAGIRFLNNIVSITRGGPGQKTAIYFATNTSDIISNRNDLYLASGSGTEAVGYFNAAQTSLFDWQIISGRDANSVSANPLFTDVTVGNFKPLSASIDNRGTPVNIIVDINNDPRSASTPDIGAYEFTPPPCTVPPTPGSASASINPICVNSAVQLQLTGNSVGLGQTYQWQYATDVAGPYTDLGSPLTSYPDTIIIASSTFYYRVVVNCSGNTVFSTPFLLSVTQGLPAGTYTIDQTAPASSTNFISFNAAKAALACGIEGPVVFNVEPGTGPYNEQLILDSIPGTSAVNTITFNGNGETIAFGSTNTDERAVIKLNSTDHITFDNLVIDGSAGTYGFGVQLINNADFNTISNCTINVNTSTTSTNFAGIVISASATSATGTGTTLCDGNVIDNNTVNGGYYGITVSGTTNNNVITHNNVRDFYDYGIYLNGSLNTLVEENDISRPVRTVTSTFYGIYVTTAAQLLKVSKNRIHNPFDASPASTSTFYGIYFTAADGPGGSENVVSNNAIYNVNGEGIEYGLYLSGSDNTRYYHNTVSLDNETSTTTSASYGFYLSTTSAGFHIKNNIFTVRRGGTVNKFGIYFSTTPGAFTSNYNDVYVSGANSYFGYYSTINQASLANWQTATLGQDANSLSIDPVYTNATAGNLEPTNSLLDDKGTPAGITTDINSLPRSGTTPDIGAWEFAVFPCTTPPTAGSSSAIPNSGICIGTSVRLSLTGNSVGAGQTYQWQYSTSSTGPWTNMGAPRVSPDTIIQASGVYYYRAAITCSGNTVFSTEILVNTNPPFQAGIYTINNTQPTGGSNFNSFVEAVAAMDCGINGPVIFNVAAGTYTEQVRMHAIAGSSNINTVTFQSANGNAGSAILTFAPTAANNYVLKLDSASNIIYKNLTITATGVTNARAIELANTASNDSLLNLVINAALSTSTSNAIAGIVGTTLRGTGNVIKGNTISNGSSGIYISGSSTTLAANDLVIDSNTVNNSYYYSIYTSNTKRIKLQKNIVNILAPRNVTTYGIYATNSDSAYQYVSNLVNVNNVTSTTTYGMYFTSCDANPLLPGRVANNKITAITGNTGTLYGLYQTASTNNNTVNNVIVINTSGASSYGIYSTGGGPNNYYNNSVNSLANSATNNYAAYFANTSGSGVDVRNNIFSHKGGGRALYVGNTSYVYSDYNMLYTTGATLVQAGAPAGSFGTLAAWKAASSSDQNSIVYQPAFTSTTNLVPNIADPEVWAIHGRGIQLPGNNYDFNNNIRPTTLTTGVPDLGAYEFLPTSTPPVLPATPATPAAGITQVFMFGTDTVSKITWKTGSIIPSTVSVRRYSGVVPPGLLPAAKYMYFYTDVDITSSSAPRYDLKQFYIDPWQGFISREPVIRLGRTNSSGTWIMDPASSVDTIKNIISRDTLNFIDKFTGLTDSTIVPPPPPPLFVQDLDTSNRGKRFWVAYGHHYGFSTNGQDMVLYLSAEQAANVKVRINGTTWQRNYSIPANTAISTDIIPKAGLFDARLTDEGKYLRSLSIESDVPIVAYAHIYQGATSGAGMLLPVGVYGYEYTSLNSRQYYPTVGAVSYSLFYVIADHDSTQVEIIPSVITKGGRPANVPFTVYLNKGEVYNVMGTISGAQGTDLTGSKIRSIPNASGKCYPIAVFSGSSRTAICNTTNGDNMIQQVFPNQAWGKRYLTFATANSASNTNYNSNMWRVMVKDPTTIVKRNGTIIPSSSLITPGNYYEFGVNNGDGPSGAGYIEADKPVLVAQYMISTGGTSCGLTAPSGDGDPELIYISPIEQGIKKAVFYNTDQSAINSNYVNIIIPTAGLASFRIDGGSTFTNVFAHPYLTGYTCIRHNLGGTAGQHIIQSDSAFTAITYGLGSVESYGYNAGTLVKNLNANGAISNVYSPSGSTNPYTCKGTPMRFKIQLNVKPTSLVWHFSLVPNLSPNVDSTQLNPTPVDSTIINGVWFYTFTVNRDYIFSAPGNYVVPVTITHSSFEGCNNSVEYGLPVVVIATPVVDYTYTFTGCLNDIAQFNGSGATSNGVPINQWSWNFGDATTSNLQNPTKQWASVGTYNVSLRGIAADGCIGDTVKPVVVGTLPVINITPDSLATCLGLGVLYSVQNPVAGITYNWYTAATGGSLVNTGTSYTFTVTAPVSYYVEAVTAGGCISTSRKKITVTILPNLAAPVVVVDSAGANLVRFRWNAVPGATGYQVSTNNGTTWINPSSGATGLTHTVTGLQPLQTVTLIVRVLGGCAEVRSQPVTGKALTDQVFIPNSFTPNGDGRNDILYIYGYIIRDMQFMIFNQWGEKVFETRNQAVGWDGTYKGKGQPSGVYIYVCEMILTDGTKMQKKGSINLVR